MHSKSALSNRTILADIGSSSGSVVFVDDVDEYDAREKFRIT